MTQVFDAVEVLVGNLRQGPRLSLRRAPYLFLAFLYRNQINAPFAAATMAPALCRAIDSDRAG
jgi:hypothetical protein